ncbi:hypothetical protein EX895_000231 [Sporisorium graminicola]|uniref:Uncharacterized protein n=1 Tax=Sporisorium graminicola TaxID=280036 RepID=A0A4U7KZJ0_9BASI|nr:hypothetical protein EX895_000231 [Sporisorium graminicola]TKY90233.1 hypothetical protein EX895_000231 [Sporisorium graminicola]
MVSHCYSTPAPSYNDPVFVRTHFLGRVASDGSGLDYQHELMKRRSSRHSEFNRWTANWLTPVTYTMDYDSDETSDTDDDVFDRHSQPANTNSKPTQHLRSRSSTLPIVDSSVAVAGPVEIARARSMTAPASSSSSSSSFESRDLRKNKTTVGSETRLMPARPLSINTAQPLRMPSPNVLDMTDELSLPISVPSPLAAVDPSPKIGSPTVVRIECSESDGSCHGDAGDQDPEAQLAAGIIRLREQRRSASSKPQRRSASKRRASMASPNSITASLPSVSDDADSDDAQSRAIRTYGGNFVLRLAEMVLDFGSSALERLVVITSDGAIEEDDSMVPTRPSPLEPRRRSSTTPKQLSAEAGELLRRRRERTGSVLSSDSTPSDSESSPRTTLTRSWSVPKLLTMPLFNPNASLQALSSSTFSTPSTPTSAPAHLHPSFGFTAISAKPTTAKDEYQELNSFDDVATCFGRHSASHLSHSTNVVGSDARAVSPLWKQ